MVLKQPRKRPAGRGRQGMEKVIQREEMGRRGGAEMKRWDGRTVRGSPSVKMSILEEETVLDRIPTVEKNGHSLPPPE